MSQVTILWIATAKPADRRLKGGASDPVRFRVDMSLSSIFLGILLPNGQIKLQTLSSIASKKKCTDGSEFFHENSQRNTSSFEGSLVAGLLKHIHDHDAAPP